MNESPTGSPLPDALGLARAMRPLRQRVPSRTRRVLDEERTIRRIVEEGENSFGAYVPDLPGCVAAADTKEEVLELIQEAIEFHIEGLREDGQPIPEPSSSIEYIEVRAA